MTTTDIKEILSAPPSLVLSSDAKEEQVTYSYAQLILDLKCDLAEGIVFDDERNKILFTDILGKQFHTLDLSTGEHRAFDCPKMLGAFAMTRSSEPRPATTTSNTSNNSSTLLCAFEDSFQLYDLENGEALSEASQGESVNPHGLPTRLNDGRCDREGAFFVCGGYYGDIDGMTMKVFSVSVSSNTTGAPLQLVHTPLIDGIRVTNSICFSVDGKTMYFADSPSQEIRSYSYDNKATITTATVAPRIEKQEKIVYERRESDGVPDGSCVDADGCIWNAVWRDGKGPSFVNRIDPTTGKTVYQVRMPNNNDNNGGTSQVSCCCFGGPDLDVLFITTAGIGIDRTKEPHSGGIYAAKVPFKGLPEARFQL